MTAAKEQASGTPPPSGYSDVACERPLVVHIITGLGVGGAERMLLKLAARLSAKFDQAVLSLTGRGKLAAELEHSGIEVHDVGIRSLRSLPGGFWRLRSWLRRRRPQVVQTWMYHADLIGGLAARSVGIRNVVWNLRATGLDREKPVVQLLQKTNALLAHHLPRAVVSCGRRVADLHVKYGYPAAKVRVIPNGFDLEVFCPDEHARRSLRKALGIPDPTPVVGSVGRLHGMKDYRTFFEAARLVRSRVPEARFLLAGRGLTVTEPMVARWVRDSGLGDAVHLLGERDDLSAVYNAMDVFVLSSASSEGFPNVVGEAMACGIPCVVTDVGDAAWIVGGHGFVVAPRDPAGLANGVAELVLAGPRHRDRLGVEARQRIRQHFGIDTVTNEYAELYWEITGSERGS